MKALLLLLLCLMLTGCGSTAGAPEPAETLYDPGGALQQRYGNALRRYRSENAWEIFSMGEDLLLVSGTETTTLTRVSGENLTVSARAELPFLLTAEDPSIRVTPSGFSCYDPNRRETLVFSEELETVRTVAAPESCLGSPILDGENLYYASPDAIWRWDLSTGIRSRVLTQSGLSLTGLESGVLICTAPQEKKTLLISVKDGQLLWEGRGKLTLSIRDNRYFASLPAGLHQNLVFGGIQGQPKLLTPKGLAEGQFLESCNGAVVKTVQGLDFYNLDSGRRSGALDLGGEEILAVEDAGGFAYILCRDALYRWDVGAAPTGDSECFTGDYGSTYLGGCQAYARDLEGRYGIRVLLGQEAAAAQPWDYLFSAETQPDTLWRQLEILDESLAVFPPEILNEFAGIKLSLVRSISGAPAASGVAEASGVQFRDEDGLCLALAVGPTSKRSLYHELYHILEPRLLEGSTALHRWDQLNPQGFSYDGRYGSVNPQDPSWLQGSTRAFIDRYSMTYAKEDRARILEYAMTPGNETLFEAPQLQAKLAALCQSIRESFALTKTDESYQWEQYLSK